ncbi:MAG: RNA-binding protein [Dorea sp.]
MNKEEIMLRKRLIELSNQTFQREIVLFSDFLNLNELNILHTTPKDMFPAKYETYGGYDLSERQMVAFLPDALYYEYEYPMKVIEIKPVNPKFAEELTHRDYLGAVMNLGIERCKLGDIIIDNGKAELFTREEIATYIAESLTRVRHTVVTTTIKDMTNLSYEPKYELIKGTVPSIRLDTILSTAYNTSRNKVTALIESAKVFVNGKLITSNGYHLKDGDIISVRGLGRISYDSVISETKKGRYLIAIKKYI